MKTDWKKRSKNYDNIAWVNRNDTLRAMIDFAGDVSSKKVLDLGTGTGKVLKTFYDEYPKASYYGIDISCDMSEHIEQKYGFNIYQGKIEELLDFEDSMFDVVTARMVFHHSEDLDKAFLQAKRVLKSGGKLIVCEGNPPNKDCISFYEEMFKYKEERYTLTNDDLTNYYARYGFDEILTRTCVLHDMSLNNWIDNSETPDENKKIIIDMHKKADDKVKKAYNMVERDDDIFMMWKFSVICGTVVK